MKKPTPVREGGRAHAASPVMTVSVGVPGPKTSRMLFAASSCMSTSASQLSLFSLSSPLYIFSTLSLIFIWAFGCVRLRSGRSQIVFACCARLWPARQRRPPVGVGVGSRR